MEEDGEPVSLGFLWGVLATVGILLAMFYKLRRLRLYKLAGELPGPPGLPIIGNALEFHGEPHKIFKEVYANTKRFQDVMRLWVGHRLLVFLSNPADIELILSSQDHIDKSPEYSFFEPWLGDGLLISSGVVWRAHRKVIAPTFHLNILKSFFPQFNRNARSALDRLRMKAGKGEFDIHDLMGASTVEILLETVMGVDKDTHMSSGYDYVKAVIKICEIIHLRHTKFWLRPDVLFNLTPYKREHDRLLQTIHGLTRKVLKTRKAEYIKNGRKLIGHAMEEPMMAQAGKEKGKEPEGTYSFGKNRGVQDDLDEDIGEKRRLAFLDYMIDASENGVMLTDKEVQNQVDTIMFEGHDTTAVAASFFLCIMAQRPDIQSKVYDELYKIFGDSDRGVTFEDTLEMKYTERCIMESLRLYPPVPIVAREMKQELKLASSRLTVPADCTVVVCTYRMHRRQDIYPEPDKFDPDRFLPESCAGRHYYSYVPFSAGPRSCVGRKYALLKLKVLLASVLRQYEVRGGTPEKEWQLQADIVLKRHEGFPISLQQRRRSTININK